MSSFDIYRDPKFCTVCSNQAMFRKCSVCGEPTCPTHSLVDGRMANDSDETSKCPDCDSKQ